MSAYMNVMDICSYCEVATDSIQKSIESGAYDTAHVQLAAYLLEIRGRYLNGEIDTETWDKTLDFYSRMTATILEEKRMQHQLSTLERED